MMTHSNSGAMYSRPRRNTLLAVAAVLSATLAACRAESRPADSATGGASAAAAPSTAAPPATPAVVAGRFTSADFAHLRFLDGSWRGQLPDGKYFYERYRVVDDSTIAQYGFADSTYATSNDSSRIVLRGTTVAVESASRWEATRLDATGVDFTSINTPTSSFTWAPVSADQWTATIRSVGRDGQPRSAVYNMERVKR
jgi:hypothetical protein